MEAQETNEVATESLLEVVGLNVNYRRDGRDFRVLDDVSMRVPSRRIVGIVGESGSGKSTLALVIMGLAERIGARVMGGEVRYRGQEILSASPTERRRMRQRELGLILQDPHSSLNPAFRVGTQIRGRLRASGTVHVDERALTALRDMNLPEPTEIMRRYPHELSGGMKQRAVGAIASGNSPSLLVADEPTTALDVTIQAQFLQTLKQLRDERGLTVLIITHDLGVVAEACDEVFVMYAGRIIETAPVAELFDRPQHPYTRGLLGSRLSADTDKSGTLQLIPGQPPNMWDLPAGCSFRPRCSEAVEDCGVSAGPLTQISGVHAVECRVAVQRERARPDSELPS